MANGSGVSVAAVGKRWRVRWRETDADERTVQRERVVPTMAIAQQLAGEIVEALKLRGHYTDPHAPPPVTSCTVDAIAIAWCHFRKGRKRAKTSANDITNTDRALKAMRTALEIPEGRPIPGAALTRENIDKVTKVLSAKYSEGTVAGTVGALVALWAWGTDDPDTFPGLRHPPRGDILPAQPTYRASEAPTMVEADASLRALSKMRGVRNVALPAAVIARWTGLRISTILAIEPGDLNVAAATLYVRVDKVKAMQGRTIAVAPELANYLAERQAEALASGRKTLLRRREGTDSGGRTPDRTLHAAWKAATVAGEVREETWAPKDRKLARPEHAYRGCVQTHLVRAGVAEEVVNVLVGHRGSTRFRHYVRPEDLMGAMREAVAKLPPIDWRMVEANNVVPIRG